MTHDDPHSRSADPVHEGKPVEAQYVRQGRSGVRILTVLVISVALAAAALLGWWLLNSGAFTETELEGGREAEASAPFDETDGVDDPAAPVTPEASQPAD